MQLVGFQGKIERGLKGHSLVSEVLQEWEGIVNRVAKSEIGEKVIVCSRSARWWDIVSPARPNPRREGLVQWSDLCFTRHDFCGALSTC